VCSAGKKSKGKSMNASAQIKTHTAKSASAKNSHILRMSDAYKNPKIIILQKPDEKFSSSKKPKLTKNEKQFEADRKKELKSINALISKYKKRILGLGDPQAEQDQERLLKMQEKLKEYEAKREELKASKQVEETRGRKKEKDYIEFELCLTGVPPTDGRVIKAFEIVQSHFLKEKFFQPLKLVTNAVHLDQHSLHSHAVFEIPRDKTWTGYLESFKKSGKEVYKEISKAWHRYCKANLEKVIGKEFEPQQSGKRYKSLKKYKEDTEYAQRDKKSVESILEHSKRILETSPSLRSIFDAAQTTDEQLRGLDNQLNEIPTDESHPQDISGAKRVRKDRR